MHAQRLESYQYSRDKNSGDNQGRGRGRDNFQARAVNNRSNNLANQEADSNRSNQSEAAQSKIQQLEKRTDESDKVMRALNERVNQLQMQPSVTIYAGAATRDTDANTDTSGTAADRKHRYEPTRTNRSKCVRIPTTRPNKLRCSANQHGSVY